MIASVLARNQWRRHLGSFINWRRWCVPGSRFLHPVPDDNKQLEATLKKERDFGFNPGNIYVPRQFDLVGNQWSVNHKPVQYNSRFLTGLIGQQRFQNWKSVVRTPFVREYWTPQFLKGPVEEKVPFGGPLMRSVKHGSETLSQTPLIGQPRFQNIKSVEKTPVVQEYCTPQDGKGPNEEKVPFRGPLMSDKMRKDELIRFIQGKSQECFQKVNDPDQQTSYFFWQIMELYYKRDGKVIMAEIAHVIFRGYRDIRKKLGPVKNLADWCIPLPRLLCSRATEEEKRKAIVEMGDDLVSRGRTYAGHICYVVARMELGSSKTFNLIGYKLLRVFQSVPQDVIERSEVYEHAMSLASGIGQPRFQMFKYLHALKLAMQGHSDQALLYCEGIAKSIFTMPCQISSRLIRSVVELSYNLLQEKAEETEWLMKLCRLNKGGRLSRPKQPSLSEKSQGSQYNVGDWLCKRLLGTVYAEEAEGKPNCEGKTLQEEDRTLPGGKRPKEEKVPFRGPLMSGKMEKDELIRFIQGKSQECFQKVNDPDQQTSYFFWQIMELYYKRDGKVMMADIAPVILQSYRDVNKQLGLVRDLEDWCIPMVGILCSSATEEEKRRAIVKLGDDLVSLGQTSAGYICYVVARMELGSRRTFRLIGCNWLYPYKSVPQDVIERSEVYEHVMSLASGIGQPRFQNFKYLHAVKLALEGHLDQALEYCEGIAKCIFMMPRHVDKPLIESVVELSYDLLQEKAEETEWLLKLCRLLRDVHAVHPPVPFKLEPSSCSEEFHEELDSRYIVGELLGAGKYGAVYAGVRKADGRPVALKYVSKSIEESFPGTKPREVKFMEMVSNSPCENVVELLEFLDVSSSFVLVLERPTPCVDLKTFCKMQLNHRLSEDEAREIMRQVVQAVDHCIAHGVFHGDLHSRNILVNLDTLKVKLIDFGCGYLVSEYEEMGNSVCIWSLGLILAEMIYGEQYTEYAHVLTKKCSEFVSPECCELLSLCLDYYINASFDEVLNHPWFKQTESSSQAPKDPGSSS